MGYLGVQYRFQIQMRSMEEFIDKENKVRFVDAFVEQLELDKLGFEIATLKIEGRPAFNPKVYLKLYFHGYLNGLRTSRKLEKEAIRNVELHWLLEGLTPNYHYILKKKSKALNFLPPQKLTRRTKLHLTVEPPIY